MARDLADESRQIALVADEPALARWAALELPRPALLLDGGLAAWHQAGLPVASTPERPTDADCIDYLFFAHDRHDGNKDAARQYLAWETGLLARLDERERADSACLAPVPTARSFKTALADAGKVMAKGELPLSRRDEFLRGVRDTLPLILGAVPFGIIFGGLAGSAGLSPWQTLGMSMLVYAGSAQFIAVSLLSGGAGLGVLLLTTLVVNLRHALYSATLQPFVRQLPRRWRLPLAFCLTDETFAVVHKRYAGGESQVHRHWYFLGSCLAMYGNWQLCTLAGVAFGQAVPNLAAWGLEFAMLATFIGIVVPMLRARPQLAAALVAAAVALVAHALPYKLGLLAAALAGIVVGTWLERRQAANDAQEGRACKAGC